MLAGRITGSRILNLLLTPGVRYMEVWSLNTVPARGNSVRGLVKSRLVGRISVLYHRRSDSSVSFSAW